MRLVESVGIAPSILGAVRVFLEPFAEEFSRDGPPDMPKIIEISSRHGIYYV
ncbi:hypothetical protein [Cerasicoccus maritimus]|uniref:hypothetical protein n=1 Tax=Cerasicoccus maritimus TaxID=490089 RepID=UPI002852C273|nr:hypothetical protein [Cerasicoccus maritimus]